MCIGIKNDKHFVCYILQLKISLPWILPGATVEMCSTTPPEDDSDPLVCPHGYVCSIDDVGNPEQGIPNKGHCVLVEDASAKSGEMTVDNRRVGCG